MGPLIPLAFGIGAARTWLGVNRAKQERRRKQGLIQQAFGIANERMNLGHDDVRQSQMEELVARGLLQGGSADLPSGTKTTTPLAEQQPTAAASVAAKSPFDVGDIKAAQERERNYATARTHAQTQVAPNSRVSGTLATQQVRDQEHEFSLERKDMEAQRNAALSDTKAAYNSAITDAIVGGVSTGMGVYNMGQQIGAMRAAPAAGPSPIKEAMMGVDDPGAWWGGVNGLDPLGKNSSWGREGTVVGAGQSNVDFRLG